jgi:hypothetical protein
MPEPSLAPQSPPAALPEAAPLSTSLPQAKRLFGQWWRRQSPARQDRFATLGPLLSVLLFLAAIISAFWYLRSEEIDREVESVKRDTELTQQQMGLRPLSTILVARPPSGLRPHGRDQATLCLPLDRPVPWFPDKAVGVSLRVQVCILDTIG